MNSLQRSSDGVQAVGAISDMDMPTSSDGVQAVGAEATGGQSQSALFDEAPQQLSSCFENSPEDAESPSRRQCNRYTRVPYTAGSPAGHNPNRSSNNINDGGEGFSAGGRIISQRLATRASNLWRSFARRSSFAIDSFLHPHLRQNSLEGPYVEEQLLPHVFPSSHLKTLSSPQYMFLLLSSFFSPDIVKQKLSRVTLMELLEHFDLFNDLFFIFRVAWAIHRGLHWHENKSAKFVMAWLLTTYMISCCAYILRRFLIYNRVPQQHSNLFCPFLVFSEIRRAGEESPEVLFMFERLCWTYQLLMRVIEDLPQVLCSVLFLINEGRDTYAMMMIAYSTTLFFITTIRMGLRYPFKGTLYLLLSSEPPIGDPVALEAAPTTYYMTLFVGGVFALWCFVYFFTLRYVNKIWRLLIILLGTAFGLLSIFCLILFAYYRRQSSVNVDEAFLRMAASDAEEGRSTYFESRT